jgi:hypothetical protein
MASIEMKTKVEQLDSNRSAFFRGYLQALGFTGRRETPEDVDNPAFDDESAFICQGDFDSNWNVWDEIQDVINDTDLQQILDDIAGFLGGEYEGQTVESLIDTDENMSGNFEQAGTDFCFTRNGEGAGFWDGDWSDGDSLTAVSKPFGTFNLVVCRNEDDEITAVYFHG